MPGISTGGPVPLTPAQLQALKNDIAANSNTVIINGVATAISAVPHSPDNAQMVANFYNQNASPSFMVFRSNIPVQDIFNQILFSNYTPNDTISSANAAQFTAWSFACQNKQLNVQSMLQNPNQQTFNAGLTNMRKGLKDGTSNLPSGGAGALVDGGWGTAAQLPSTPATGIQSTLTRAASWIEKLFAVQDANGPDVISTDPLGGITNPALLVVDSLPVAGVATSPLQASDILNAWGS